MKTSFVSTPVLQNSLRLQIQQSQAALAKAQQEATTGKVADTGLALGSKTSSDISLTGEVGQMQAILDTNGLVAQRLQSSQAALSQMSDNAQTALDVLVSLTGSSSSTQLQAAQDTVRNAFQSFIGAANTSTDGTYIFAGTQTDTQPLDDYLAPDSQTKATFDSAFQTTFQCSPDDPAAADISGADMRAFLDGPVADMFTGSGWQGPRGLSQASDKPLTSRIDTNQVIDSSITTNSDGMRKFTMASVIGVELLDGNFSNDALNAITQSLSNTMGSAVSGLTADSSTLGIAQSRVSKANDSLNSRMDIINTQIGNLEGVDPYDAATRVNALTTQIETSYTLTARLQQLSLVNYL